VKQISGAFDPDIRSAVRELRAYRRMTGMSIRELGKLSGIGQFALLRWEAERRMPDMINLRIWAEALGYTIKVTLEVPE